jgi:hypothetical protein
MKNHVKGFGKWINESKFHKSLPNRAAGGSGRLRDEYRSLSGDEQSDIDALAQMLDSKGMLADFTRTLSRFSSIEELKAAMQDWTREREGSDEPGWSVPISFGGVAPEDNDWSKGGYYYSSEE